MRLFLVNGLFLNHSAFNDIATEDAFKSLLWTLLWCSLFANREIRLGYIESFFQQNEKL